MKIFWMFVNLVKKIIKLVFFELFMFVWSKIKYILIMNLLGYLMKLMLCKILLFVCGSGVDYRWFVFNIL